MSGEDFKWIAALMLLPWCIFVTVSIFNQRQELALLKQSLSEITKIFSYIVDLKIKREKD